ncbi:MAG: ATP-binding protein, partial [Lewinella sp.]|nr:ATP-binding protein [Lewinella sp.]
DKMEDLINRMEEHADEVLHPLNVRYDLQVQNLDRQQVIPANVRQDLYFIYKEAINNVAKHAQASRVDIRMQVDGSSFEMIVHDDGVGFDTEHTTSRRGQGLSNLRMRAQRLKAHLEMVNGHGTTIRLKMKKFS